MKNNIIFIFTISHHENKFSLVFWKSMKKFVEWNRILWKSMTNGIGRQFWHQLFYAFFWVSFMSEYCVWAKNVIFWMITHLCMPQVAKWYCCSNAIYHRIHTCFEGELEQENWLVVTMIFPHKFYVYTLYFCTLKTQIFLPFQEFFYEENEAQAN